MWMQIRILAALFPVQHPADGLGMAGKDGLWIWKDFLAPGLGLAQSWLLLTSEDWTSG